MNEFRDNAIDSRVPNDLRDVVWEASAMAKTEVNAAITFLVSFMDGQRDMQLLANAIELLINANSTYERIESVVSAYLGEN